LTVSGLLGGMCSIEAGVEFDDGGALVEGVAKVLGRPGGRIQKRLPFSFCGDGECRADPCQFPLAGFGGFDAFYGGDDLGILATPLELFPERE